MILLVFGLSLVVLILGQIYKYEVSSVEPFEKVHLHAGFVVFEDGKRIDFSGDKYMHIEPCEEHEDDEQSPQKLQEEKAHLHENVGDVVHSHIGGARWEDLFTNVFFSIDYPKSTGYINGVKVKEFQESRINANDSLVVFIGSVDEDLLSQAVTLEHIKEIENISEDCGDVE